MEQKNLQEQHLLMHSIFLNIKNWKAKKRLLTKLLLSVKMVQQALLNRLKFSGRKKFQAVMALNSTQERTLHFVHLQLQIHLVQQMVLQIKLMMALFLPVNGVGRLQMEALTLIQVKKQISVVGLYIMQTAVAQEKALILIQLILNFSMQEMMEKNCQILQMQEHYKE